MTAEDLWRLGSHTWTEVDADLSRFLLAVPVGSTEQHGPHLPLDTDTRVAVALCEALASANGDVIVAPALSYGASGEHAGFGSTLSIGTEALSHTLIELVRSASAFSGVIIVNGHGGNRDALAEVSRVAGIERRGLLVWSPNITGGDPHAGHVETSLMAHLAPGAVRWERVVVGRVEPLATLIDQVRESGVRAVSPTGVLGDPRRASAAAGRELFEAMVAALGRAVDRWDRARLGLA
jgi:mycofactocin precursor peptide peptidase